MLVRVSVMVNELLRHLGIESKLLVAWSHRIDEADCVVRRNADATQTGYDQLRANFGVSLIPGSGLIDPIARVPASAEPLSAVVPEPSSVLIVVAVATLATFRALFAVRRRSIV